MNVAMSCIVFVLLATTFLHIKGSRLVYHNDASLPDELDLMELFIGEPPSPGIMKRDETSPKGATGLWFGPRLGRRRRSVDVDASRDKREIYGDNQQGKILALTLDALREAKKNSKFTPRLGRDSEEELIENFMYPMYGSYGKTPTRSEPQPSALTGITGANFTPRLGRLAPLDSH